MIPSTEGSNPSGSGDEPDRPTNTEIILKQMEIKFKKLNPKAVIPTKAHIADAGFDLTCVEITTEINECGQLILVYHTGIAVEIPEGYFGMFVPRSSIYKKSLMLVNSPGIIDSNYRGEVTGKFRATTDVVPSVYKPEERFAQLLILPLPEVTFTESSELSTTDRGENGYGSTGEAIIENESAPTGSVEPSAITEDTTEQTAPEVAAGDISAPEQAE